MFCWGAAKASVMVHVRDVMGKLIGRQARALQRPFEVRALKTRSQESQPVDKLPITSAASAACTRRAWLQKSEPRHQKSRHLAPRTRTTARARRLRPRPR